MQPCQPCRPCRPCEIPWGARSPGSRGQLALPYEYDPVTGRPLWGSLCGQCGRRTERAWGGRMCIRCYLALDAPGGPLARVC